MRVMVLVKANDRTEAGEMPSQELLTQMGAYNEQLAKAGILLAGDGLHASSKGKRVCFEADGGTSVVDGPFSETKELLAGYWVWQVSDMDEAAEWAKRMPNPEGDVFHLELRRVFDPEDFGDALTPELREAEAKLSEQLTARG